MGRRFEKKVTTDGAVALHERYIYRGYLQIAAVDLLANTTKHAILWDPTQPTAMRPLAIQQGKAWYTYAWDLTKNITALFTSKGAISTTYTYTPFGKVTAQGDTKQDIQWSSEYHDTETALVYYNYRYYNPTDGRWTRRDPIGIKGGILLYGFMSNPINCTDAIGLKYSFVEEDVTSFIPRRVPYLPGYEEGRVVYFPVSKSTTPKDGYFGNCAVGFEGKPKMYIEILDDNKLKTPYNIVLEHEYEHVKIIKKIWNKFAKTANEIKEESAIICCKCIDASKKYIEVLRDACDAEIKYEDAKLEEKDHSATPHNVPATRSNFLLAKKNANKERRNYEKACK